MESRASNEAEVAAPRPLPVIALMTCLAPYVGVGALHVFMAIFVVSSLAVLTGGLEASALSLVLANVCLSLLTMVGKPVAVYVGLVYGTRLITVLRAKPTARTIVFATGFVPLVALLVFQALVVHVLHRYLPAYHILGVRTFLLLVASTAAVSLMAGVDFADVQRRFLKAMNADAAAFNLAPLTTPTLSNATGNGNSNSNSNSNNSGNSTSSQSSSTPLPALPLDDAASSASSTSSSPSPPLSSSTPVIPLAPIAMLPRSSPTPERRLKASQ